MQRSEILAASLVGLVAALLFVLGDSSFVEGLVGVSALAAIVLLWFWGWRQYYESDWPQRMSTSRVRYLRAIAWGSLAGGGLAGILAELGVSDAIRIPLGLAVWVLVAMEQAGDIREELRVSRSQPSSR